MVGEVSLDFDLVLVSCFHLHLLGFQGIFNQKENFENYLLGMIVLALVYQCYFTAVEAQMLDRWG
jgi:hypothetical protein